MVKKLLNRPWNCFEYFLECEVEENTARPNNDLKKIKDVESVEACREECRQVDGATHFTWRGQDSMPKRKRKKCFCKDKSGTPETKTDVYSGVTQC